MRVIVCQDYESLSKKAAHMVARQVFKKPDSVLGLATGGTPEGMYRQLVRYYRERIVSFQAIRTVNLDEYIGLSPTHEESYAYYMQKHLFDHVDVDRGNVHLLNGLAEDTEAECQRYEQRIFDLGGIDFQVLGIGRNGHIGFNEPGGHFARETHRVDLDAQTSLDNARYFDSPCEVPKQALTVGLKSIMQAREIVLLASGEGKAQAVFEAIQGEIRPELPASLLQFHPWVTFVLDKQAASLLKDGRYVFERQ